MIRKALVLAAGLGSRLYPLTRHTPKPLLRVGNRRLIEYSLSLLARAGISEVGINLHHLGDQIRQFVGSGRQYGLSVHFFPERDLLGTGGAVKNMQSFIHDEPFVLVNADVITDLELKEVLQSHERASPIATMVLEDRFRNPDPDEVRVDDAGRVLSINGIPDGSSEGPSRKFTGISVLSPEVYDYLPDGRSSIIQHFFQPAIAGDKKVHAFLHSGFWVDAGSKSILMTLQENPPF